MLVKLAEAAFGFHKTRTYSDMYAGSKPAATEQQIAALGSGPVGRFLSGPIAEGGVIYKLAMHKTNSKKILAHRETGTQVGDPIPHHLAKQHCESYGLKSRVKKMKDADNWEPRPLA